MTNRPATTVAWEHSVSKHLAPRGADDRAAGCFDERSGEDPALRPTVGPVGRTNQVLAVNANRPKTVEVSRADNSIAFRLGI